MNDKELRKQSPELWRLWVKHGFKFGGDPTPKTGRRYILSVSSDLERCFVLIEYEDEMMSQMVDGRVREVNMKSAELLSFESAEITEYSFIGMLHYLIQLYSIDNQLVVCCRTNGTGQTIQDELSSRVLNTLYLENVRFFPTAARSNSGNELFTILHRGWEMTADDEKTCFDAMRTATEQGYFLLVTDQSKQAFEIMATTEIISVSPFIHCWSMLSYIRLANMHLFFE